VIQSIGSRFSGLRSAQPSSKQGWLEERSFDVDFAHLSLCHPETRDILDGGLESRVLIFLLRFEKQCLVIIRKSCLLVPSASSLIAGFSTTILDCTRGEGANELGGTFLSKETSKSSHRFNPNGPMSYGADVIAILCANSSWTSSMESLIGSEWWYLAILSIIGLDIWYGRLEITWVIPRGHLSETASAS